MKRWVLLASSRPDAGAAEVETWLAAVRRLAGSPDVLDADAGRVLPGSVAAADVTADVWMRDARPISGLPGVAEILGGNSVETVEALPLSIVAERRVDIPGPRVKRTLALTVRNGTSQRDIERFERSLAAMPDHISEIRSWSLSRVTPGPASGHWTHVWEQEYSDVDGVRVAYLQHPYHWTGVDRWFDPEMPCSIVEPKLAHLFRWVDRPIVAGWQ